MGLEAMTGVEDYFALGIGSVLNLNGLDDKEIGGYLTFDYEINLLTGEDGADLVGYIFGMVIIFVNLG